MLKIFNKLRFGWTIAATVLLSLACLSSYPVAAPAHQEKVQDNTVLTAEAAPKTDDLEIKPGNITVPSTQRAVIMKAVCKKSVKWIVVASSNPSFLEIPQTKQIVIFPNSTTDKILVYAFTATDSGEPSEPALAVITVQGPQPPPDKPTPDPIPDTEPTKPVVTSPKLIVTFVVDGNAKNIDKVSRIVDSKDIVDYLKNNGHARYVRDYTSPDGKKRIDDLNLTKFVNAAGGPPVVVIQTYNPGKSNHGQVLFTGKLPASTQDVLNLVKKYSSVGESED